jgi:hypothetical protein
MKTEIRESPAYPRKFSRRQLGLSIVAIVVGVPTAASSLRTMRTDPPEYSDAKKAFETNNPQPFPHSMIKEAETTLAHAAAEIETEGDNLTVFGNNEQNFDHIRTIVSSPDVQAAEQVVKEEAAWNNQRDVYLEPFQISDTRANIVAGAYFGGAAAAIGGAINIFRLHRQSSNTTSENQLAIPTQISKA